MRGVATSFNNFDLRHPAIDGDNHKTAIQRRATLQLKRAGVSFVVVMRRARRPILRSGWAGADGFLCFHRVQRVVLAGDRHLAGDRAEELNPFVALFDGNCGFWCA
jgi:hypothetical protein